MVDIHSHILPEQDDGARTPEDALAMVRMAAASGTTDIVASPHADPRYIFLPEQVKEKIAALQLAAGPLPRIHYGCDFHLTPENIDDAIAFPQKYSIDHRGYLLVEFADDAIPRTIENIFARMRMAGLRPIITHPERNPWLRKRLPDLESWVQQGCLLQVTAQSLTGRFGRTARSFSEELMGMDLVHFLASDAHDCRHRTPALQEVWRHIARQFSEGTAHRLLEANPRAALAGEDLPPAPPLVRKKSWFARLRGKA